MTVTIAGLRFDRVRYDAEGDVLYLHRGDPATAVDFDESPEGHALRFDAAGELVGVTLIGARAGIDRDGQVSLTLPSRVIVGLDEIGDAIAA